MMMGNESGVYYLKLSRMLLLIATTLFVFTSAILYAKDSTVCRKGEVRYEGGAIACPACKDLAYNYIPDPKYTDDINEHMKKALADDLESARWLINYFSDPIHKNYAQSKKWFGRALGIGANAADLRLPAGYDESYLASASFEHSKIKVSVISSCHSVDENWQPLCYKQTIQLTYPTKPNGSLQSVNSSYSFSVNNTAYKHNPYYFSTVKIYKQEKTVLIVLESTDAKYPGIVSRTDYFAFIFACSQFDSAENCHVFENCQPDSSPYIGSSSIDIGSSLKINILYDQEMTACRRKATLLEPEMLDRVNSIIADDTSCQGEFDVKPYPAVAK